MPKRTATTSASTAKAPQDKFDAAIATGISALLSLAKEYPADPLVLRAVAHTYMAQKNGVEALRWLAKVLALNGHIVRDGELRQATMLAVNDRDAVEDTIALLENELGARGVDVLYTLTVSPGPSRIKLRVKQSLAEPEVQAHASAAAAIAIELRAADRCEAKHALLPRAAKVGDRRSLTQIHNCGPYGMIDCWGCRRQDGALQSAMTTLEARAAPPPGP